MIHNDFKMISILLTEARSPLLGVYILRMTRLRIKVVSQPLCVDQLNPAGFDVPNVLIRKTPALFLRGKLEI